MSATAEACPRDTLCLAIALPDAEALVAPRPELALRLDRVARIDRVPGGAMLAKAIATAPKPPPPPSRDDEPEVPWIWQQLHDSVYDRMPHYEQDRFTMVLSPVIVSGSFDSVPGVGLSGDF
ncbi:MAG TPA: hypothetical protein VFQ53_19515 [Kofleriaceae bacterium]|nr:hypothetical protein [Kofleriaceae bacterium]